MMIEDGEDGEPRCAVSCDVLINQAHIFQCFKLVALCIDNVQDISSSLTDKY